MKMTFFSVFGEHNLYPGVVALVRKPEWCDQDLSVRKPNLLSQALHPCGVNKTQSQLAETENHVREGAIFPHKRIFWVL